MSFLFLVIARVAIAFSQEAVGNILVNRIPSWSGKPIHNVNTCIHLHNDKR